MGESLPQDNLDASVRRWVTDVLAGSPLPMLAEPRERQAVADRLMADLDDRSRLVLEAVGRRYDEGELTRLQGHLRKTLAGVPVQRVVGWTEFRGLGSAVPETSSPTAWNRRGWVARGHVQSRRHVRVWPVRVVDVGTGSGCMALSIKQSGHIGRWWPWTSPSGRWRRPGPTRTNWGWTWSSSRRMPSM